MAYIHDRSADCTKSELDLFESPPTQTSLERADWYQYPPAATITENGPVDFYISGSGQEYVDLMHTSLYLRLRITQRDGNPLAADIRVGPANNFLHSLFSQVEVSLNGKIVGHANSLYPYRAMLETLMNYGPEAGKGALQTALFYKDTAGNMDITDPRITNHQGLVVGFHNPLPEHVILVAAAQAGDPPVPQARAKAVGNQGLHWRWLSSRESQWMELMGPIHADIFQQEKYMVNNVDMAVKFTRSKPEFCLMGGEGGGAAYRIDIQDATLFVRKVAVADHVFLAHQHTLLSNNAIYPISHVVMRTFSIPQGNLSGPQDNVFLGQLPQEVLVVFVDNDAASGNYEKNPYNFKHMGVSHFVATYGGLQVPATPLSPHYIDGQPNGGLYTRALHQLYAANSKLMRDKGCMVEREDFPRGYAIYGFDFRPDIGCRGHFALVKTGAVQFDIKFRQALPQTINMIVYAAFDSFMEITHSREVITSN